MMKVLTRLSLAALLCASIGFAADQSWLGKVSDTCAAKDGKAPEGCTGPKYVLISRGKTYQIANQDYPGLATRAGAMAKVNGTLSGDTITITSIAESSRSAK